MKEFLLGAFAMASLVASMFFLRFYRRTGDRLFLMFAISFLVESVNRAVLAHSQYSSEGEPLLYLVRLLSYVLILAGIIMKNVGNRSRS